MRRPSSTLCRNTTASRSNLSFRGLLIAASNWPTSSRMLAYESDIYRREPSTKQPMPPLSSTTLRDTISMSQPVCFFFKSEPDLFYTKPMQASCIRACQVCYAAEPVSSSRALATLLTSDFKDLISSSWSWARPDTSSILRIASSADLANSAECFWAISCLALAN